MDTSLQGLWDMEQSQLAIERERNSPDEVIWKWSPLDIHTFDIMLHVAYDYIYDNWPDKIRPGEISFVEAGSGIGTKLYLAQHKYRMAAYGYEINPEYVTKARLLGVACEVRDLAQDPEPIWAAYDIVYTCRPFKSDIQEVKWERSVQEAMRPGAILMAAFVALKPYKWNCLYRYPFRGIWVKPGLTSPEPEAAERQLANVGTR